MDQWGKQSDQLSFYSGRATSGFGGAFGKTYTWIILDILGSIYTGWNALIEILVCKISRVLLVLCTAFWSLVRITAPVPLVLLSFSVRWFSHCSMMISQCPNLPFGALRTTAKACQGHRGCARVSACIAWRFARPHDDAGLNDEDDENDEDEGG